MFSFLKKRSATQRIPAEAYALIDVINRRYSSIDFSKGTYESLNEDEKLRILISDINQDSDLHKLNALEMIGSLIVFCQDRVTSSGGRGQNLCFGSKGLYVYDWDDYKPKFNEIPASPENFVKLNIAVNSQMVCESIIDYTQKDNYIQRVMDYNKFVA